MIEQAEKQLNPTTERISPQSGVETGIEETSVKVNLPSRVQPQQDFGQSSPAYVAPEFEAPQQTLPNQTNSAGDTWKKTIEEKRLGVAPKVL